MMNCNFSYRVAWTVFCLFTVVFVLGCSDTDAKDASDGGAGDDSDLGESSNADEDAQDDESSESDDGESGDDEEVNDDEEEDEESEESDDNVSDEDEDEEDESADDESAESEDENIAQDEDAELDVDEVESEDEDVSVDEDTESEPEDESPDTEPDTTADTGSEDETGDPSDTNDDVVSGDGNFDVDITISDMIGTVGIVEWSLDVSIEEAQIEFGRDEGEMEYVADVDLAEEDYRTLLLGMKPSETYYVRIIAQGGGSTYTSDVYSVETDPQRAGLPVFDFVSEKEGALFSGFTIGCSGAGRGGMVGDDGGTAWAFIIDNDGDYVWWYELTGSASQCVRTRMSYDGRHMWMGNGNVQATDGVLVRVTMDGQDERVYDLPPRHHDFAVLENNNIAYIVRENAGTGGGGMGSGEGADLLLELEPESGTSTEIYNQSTDFASEVEQYGAHTNAINYVPHANALSFSMLNFDTVAMVSYPEGELLATYGGPKTDFSNMSWDRQHQHHVIEDGVLIFNNNGSAGGSSALEYTITGGSAELVMDYATGLSTQTHGDVKRLPNGNTMVTYSNVGVIHELDPTGELLRSISTNTIGYVVRRTTLYGPPPPYVW